MISRAIPIAALAAAALIAAAPASAQLYKWTDANGRVQYSDKPPPAGQKASQLSKAGTTSAGVPGADAARPAGQKSTAELEQEFRKRQAEKDEAQQKAEKLAEETRAKQENCARSKAALASYEAGGRLARVDASGQRQFLDDAEVQQETLRARQDVSKWCGY